MGVSVEYSVSLYCGSSTPGGMVSTALTCLQGNQFIRVSYALIYDLSHSPGSVVSAALTLFQGYQFTRASYAPNYGMSHSPDGMVMSILIYLQGHQIIRIVFSFSLLIQVTNYELALFLSGDTAGVSVECNASQLCGTTTPGSMVSAALTYFQGYQFIRASHASQFRSHSPESVVILTYSQDHQFTRISYSSTFLVQFISPESISRSLYGVTVVIVLLLPSYKRSSSFENVTSTVTYFQSNHFNSDFSASERPCSVHSLSQFNYSYNDVNMGQTYLLYDGTVVVVCLSASQYDRGPCLESLVNVYFIYLRDELFMRFLTSRQIIGLRLLCLPNICSLNWNLSTPNVSNQLTYCNTPNAQSELAKNTIKHFLLRLILRRRYLKFHKGVISFQALYRGYRARKTVQETLKYYRAVLQECSQTEPTNFCSLFENKSLFRVGFGSFGHCYAEKIKGETKTIYKVIPLSILPGESLSFSDINMALLDLQANKAINSLRTGLNNKTTSFTYLSNSWLVKGQISPSIEEADNKFNPKKTTRYPQLADLHASTYLVLELEYGGIDLYSIKTLSPQNIVSIYAQLGLALQVAELELEFEHRDLHEGNVIVLPTTDKYIEFMIAGRILQVPSYGLKATIIDFSFARYRFNGKVKHVDLPFGSRDFRYKCTDGDWKAYCPETNQMYLIKLVKYMLNYCSRNYTIKEKHVSMYEEQKWVLGIKCFTNFTEFYETRLKPRLKAFKKTWLKRFKALLCCK